MAVKRSQETLINHSAAIAVMSHLGATNRNIGKKLGISRRQVLRDKRKITEALKTTSTYTAARETVLSHVELEVLRSLLVPDKLASASLRDCARAFQVVHHANRLERGESTNNTAVNVALLPVSYGEYSPDCPTVGQHEEITAEVSEPTDKSHYLSITSEPAVIQAEAGQEAEPMPAPLLPPPAETLTPSVSLKSLRPKRSKVKPEPDEQTGQTEPEPD